MRVLQFPVRRRASAHTRASAATGAVVSFLAAKAVNLTASTPAAAATSVAIRAAHQSEGMLSRWRHLLTRDGLTPMADASASIDGQRSITDLKESSEFMSDNIGRIVLKCKADMSYDCGHLVRQVPDMGKDLTESEQRKAFIARTKLARQSRFATQGPMLVILGLDQGTYKQYETRTPLPHRYIPKFCAACGVTMEWLLANEGAAPAVPFAKPKGRKAA